METLVVDALVSFFSLTSAFDLDSYTLMGCLLFEGLNSSVSSQNPTQQANKGNNGDEESSIVR